MEFYHVLNRGVDKRDVVIDDGDRMRFVRSLYVYNDSNPAPNFTSQLKQWEDWKRKRDPLVYIHAWCLMNNHYHILLSPVSDDLNNLTSFMRKLNMGYAKFFNEKHNRVGYLWQGRYKKIHLERDAHFQYIPYYIHLNPLDAAFPEWRRGGLGDCRAALNFLSEHRWSSYQDYNGKSNFSSVIYQKVYSDMLGSEENQTNNIRKIITNAEISATSDVIET